MSMADRIKNDLNSIIPMIKNNTAYQHNSTDSFLEYKSVTGTLEVTLMYPGNEDSNGWITVVYMENLNSGEWEIEMKHGNYSDSRGTYKSGTWNGFCEFYNRSVLAAELSGSYIKY